MNNQPIGVIDSGVGGLTILKRLIKDFPMESFIYFGDTKNAPYGEKSKNEVISLTKNMIRLMESKHVKGIVVACNTISASGALQSIKTQIPFIMEIVRPTATYAVKQAPSKNFTLLATELTIKSKLYQKEIIQAIPDATISTYSLPSLVTLSEKKEFSSAEAEEAIKGACSSIQANSIVILGCTHYPFFLPIFRKLLEPTTILIESSIPISNRLREELANRGLHSGVKKKNEYYCSGEKKVIDTIINTYLM